MSDEKRESEELSPLESALAELLPRAVGLNRDEILFKAGQASVARQSQRPGVRDRWGWPAAFAAMTTVAATLLVMLVSQPGPAIATAPDEPGATNVAPANEVDIDEMDIDSNSSPTGADLEETNPADVPQAAMSRAVAMRLRNALGTRREGAAYLDLRDRVLAFGLDWSPPPRGDHAAGDPASAPSHQQLRDRLLGI